MAEEKLKKFTVDIRNKLQKKEITLAKMTLKQLKQYQYGMFSNFPESNQEIQYLKSQISEKEAQEAVKAKEAKAKEKQMKEQEKRIRQEHLKASRQPTIAEKAACWWSAMAIIYAILAVVLIGLPYGITQVILVKQEWLRYLLIVYMLVATAGVIIHIVTQIWPRRLLSHWARRNDEQF